MLLSAQTLFDQTLREVLRLAHSDLWSQGVTGQTTKPPRLQTVREAISRVRDATRRGLETPVDYPTKRLPGVVAKGFHEAELPPVV